MLDEAAGSPSAAMYCTRWDGRLKPGGSGRPLSAQPELRDRVRVGSQAGGAGAGGGQVAINVWLR